MAGGVEVWAVWDDKVWFWVFGDPTNKVQGVTCAQMERAPDLDQYEVVTADGRKLVVTGQEVWRAQRQHDDWPKPLLGLHDGDDKPYIGFDDLPEPEFGTGWEDFDWSS